MNENKIVYKEIDFKGKKLSFETGKLATMTNMSVKASWGETVILVTAVSGGYNPDIDFFPLTVNYIEKFYASGSVKSSRFQKRDGRATDEAIIVGRTIDHAIRPLFNEDFMDDVQVVVTVLSLDPDCDVKFLSMITVSAALHASDIPWRGPMVSGRIGYNGDDYVMCPNRDELHENSDLDLMVSFVGDDYRFLALEAEANILPEDKILGAIEYARNNLSPVYQLIKEFTHEVNPEGTKYEYESRMLPEDLMEAVGAIAKEKIDELMASGKEKDELQTELDKLSEEVVTTLEGKFKKVDMQAAIDELKKKSMQKLILETSTRPDGRGLKEVRPINSEIGVLPRTHGSALFSRGLTQVLTTATLASPSEELLIQDMYGERSKRFLHYYNFPPYSSGETGRIGYPKNREIGHGMIAENALRPVVPDQKDFPYMILLVSETLSSNGSTSMASTCGATLSLMDAGVPITDMVAGIGVGLMANEDFSKTLILTDLAYMEDGFGLMDFKMTGTRKGVTAIQCDMKSAGIPFDLLPKIIEQANEARMHVLDEMEKTITSPRDTVSKYAPKTVTIKIDPDKIGVVIGSGGKTIKEIQEKTSSVISIEEDGTVVVSADSEDNCNQAVAIVEGLTKDVEPGEIYEGVVEEIVDFGAFVEILPGKTGLLHISELSDEFVSDVSEVVNPGDKVKVRVLDVSRDGKMSLSIKAVDKEFDPEEHKRRPSGRNGGGRNNRSNSRRR